MRSRQLISLALTAAVTACATRSPPPTHPSQEMVLPATAPEQLLVLHASLGKRTLMVERDGETVAVYRIAVGKTSNPTPMGKFEIQRLIWNPRWVPPDSPWARGKTLKKSNDPASPMQSVKMFFREPRYYIHGTNEEQSIGRAASQGCIRMTAEDAARLARLMMESTGQSRPDHWYREVPTLNTEVYVQLPRSIALNIVR